MCKLDYLEDITTLTRLVRLCIEGECDIEIAKQMY
jgi:hypothetical protein